MTKDEFLFSTLPRHRKLRHVSFWLIWCLSFNLFFHLPNHVVRGWDLSGSELQNPNLQKLGPALFFIKTLIVNSWLAVIVPQVLFTYALIYWLLPCYFYKRRNIFFSFSIAVSVLAIYFFIAVAFKYSVPLYNTIWLEPYKFPAIWDMGHFILIDQLTTLPIVTGIALMIKLFKRWWLKQKETELLASEKAKAELQLLKAQIHPHFLFNTLNNIYFFTLNASPKAPELIKKLSDLLQYILNECNKPLVPLEKEINMVCDYMELEKIRYGEQMKMTIEIPIYTFASSVEFKNKFIAPLLLIPFIENCFKHGASKMIVHPFVELRISIENNWLNVYIRNSRPKTLVQSPSKGNIGLNNVKKRLQLLYPETHELNIISESETFTVLLKVELKVKDANSLQEEEEEIKQTTTYVMA